LSFAPQWQDIETAQKRIIKLEARVKAADELAEALDKMIHFRPVSQENVRLMQTALEAYRATGSKQW